MGEHAVLNSQNAIARRSGVAQTTIGYMLRPHAHTGSPKLDNIERIAEAFGVSVSELLKEPAVQHQEAGDNRLPARSLTSPKNEPSVSPRARSIIERLTAIERTHCSPPALYALIENALDLVQPAAGPGDYPGLNDLTAE